MQQSLAKTPERAEQVRQQLETEKQNFVRNFFEISKLLTEIYNNKYYEFWGYGSFIDYVESSDLDINQTTAYRMVNLVNGQKALDIPTEELLVVKPTKLLEIFSLNKEANGDDIKKLLEEAKTDTIDEVRNKVRQAKGLSTDVWMKFKLTDDMADTVNAALEKAKQESGDIIDHNTGEVLTISNSRALELICANYLA